MTELRRSTLGKEPGALEESDGGEGSVGPLAREPLRERQPQGEHKCTVCADVFDTEEDLRRHQMQRHGAAPSPG